MRTIVLTLLLGVALFVPAAAKEDDRLATIHLPESFVIEPFAEVPNARQMAWGEKGTLFVGTRREGRVFAVTDEDGDGHGERVREVASGLRMPSGAAFHDGALFVAAVSTILRFDDIESRLYDPPVPVIVTDRLPSDGHHGWKVLEFGPDGLLYFPVGAPCDVCRTEGYHGTIVLRSALERPPFALFAVPTRCLKIGELYTKVTKLPLARPRSPADIDRLHKRLGHLLQRPFKPQVFCKFGS